MPVAWKTAPIALRCAVPSTIAASTTCPLPESARLEQRREHADHEVRRPAAEVAEQVRGEVRTRPVLAEAEQRAGDRDVVHVVARGVRQRAGLAPPGHPREHQPLVAGVAHVGSEAEPLGGARAHPLDQHVGPLDQPQHGLHRLRPLEVQRHAGAATGEDVVRAAAQQPAARAVDAHHVGAEVGQDHARVRTGADPGELDHLDPGERSGALSECVGHGAESCRGLTRGGPGRGLRGRGATAARPGTSRARSRSPAGRRAPARRAPHRRRVAGGRHR